MFRHYACCWHSALLALALCSPMASGAQPAAKTDTILVNGAVQSPGRWSADKIARDFASDTKLIDYTLKGKPGQAHAVPLLKLIVAAKPKIDPKQKNHLLAFAVVVRAADGYTAAFSLAELQPDIARTDVYLALDKDGRPLPENQRPVSLLVTTDKKPSRWVHGVISITVVDGVAAASKSD